MLKRYAVLTKRFVQFIKNVNESFSKRSRSLYWNFSQYFYGILYPGHPLTSTDNFMEMSQGNPSVRGVKPKRGSKI